MMNILIADDVNGWLVFNQQNLEKFFGVENVNFFKFSSAREAYDFAFSFKERIDLVITDLEMEQMYDEPAGAWLIEMLKSTKSTELAKYIIISSSYNIKFIAEDKNVDGYLRKPVYHLHPENLSYLLEELFGARKQCN